MSYNAYLAQSGTLGVWEPWASPISMALLLGRTPTGWYDPAASRLPRELTSRGVWCVAVDVPNWGNSTDMTTVDSALSFAAGQGRDVDRLAIYAYQRGAIAAVNWSARHVDRVASLTVISDIIDLEEHYTRVPGDQSSMNAAYGGSQATFNAAMPTWNPVQGDTRAWGRRVLEQLANRMTMWWNQLDTVTPPAVHQALATYYRCSTGVLAVTLDPTLAEIIDVVSQAQEQAAAWKPNPSRLWQMWSTQRRDNTSTTDWAGSDGNHRIALPDGRAVWTQNDFRTGTVNSDESRTGGTIVHNCGVIENADGTLGSQLFRTGTSGPWLTPPVTGGGEWYWLNDGIIEGDLLQMITLHLIPVTGAFGFEITDVHVVSVDRASLVQVGAQARNLDPDHSWGGSMNNWFGHTYITGGAPGGFLSGRTVLARAVQGDVLGPWEEWDGTKWNPASNTAAPLRALDGTEVPVGAGGIHKIPGGSWILSGGESAFAKHLQIWTSDWGPFRPNTWQHYLTIPMEPWSSMIVQGTTPLTYGGSTMFLAHADDDELILSFNVNHGAAGNIDTGLYQPQYVSCPRPGGCP